MSLIHGDRLTNVDSNAPADREQLIRQQAIEQIELKRRFRISTAVGAIGRSSGRSSARRHTLTSLEKSR